LDLDLTDTPTCTADHVALDPPAVQPEGGDRPKPRIDGRVARSQRTIAHIVQALLDLLERDGDLRPTAHQVAVRAGVSRRALYLHFDSLDVLFATAAERRTTEICSRWQPPALDRPLPVRIDWFVRHWTVLCEALLPLHRAAALYEPFSPQVQQTFNRARRWARSAVELVFLPELACTSRDDREVLARALHHVTSWNGWNDLRRQGSSVEQGACAMHRLLTALLDT
jgi:TetR/AcrR family transcriptional regulator of autoinduction and epiphytic fitness